MGSKVHRVRFYNPKPLSINCISYNKLLKLIAVARTDASIEVWDLNYAPYLTRFIPGVENGSVEALGWVQGRLLSTGLRGALVEWDISKETQKNSVMLTGYAAWCLDVDSANTHVAVGTEHGYINLYSVEDDDILYKKLFDKQEGRVMCCKFNTTGNILVTGSMDTIRLWNVATGHATTRLSISRQNNEVIVWTVAILSDNTIVSGDSYGRLTFWDGVLGEQIESYTTHKADVLTVAVSEDEKHVYCSGVDPTISHFVKVQNVTTQPNARPTAQWVKHIQRHIHEHDVKSILVCDGKLVSVGLDGYLTLSKYPPKWVIRMPPMIPPPRSSVCPMKKLLLLRYNNHLDVWKLGSYATNESGDVISSYNIEDESNKNESKENIEQDSVAFNDGIVNANKEQHLGLAENPVKIVSIRTKHKKPIKCCALSPTGEFIVYATDKDVRLLKLDIDWDEEEQTNVSLSKVLINGLSSPCNRIAFTEDSRTMLVHSEGQLFALQVDPEAGATVMQAINLRLKTPSILHLIVSSQTKSGATYVVVADTNGSMEVLVEKKKYKFVHYVTLPKYKCVPSAMTVDSERETLIIVYVDQKVIEYDLAEQRFSGWPGEMLPTEWDSRQSAVVSVSVHPRRNAVVFQDENALWTLERDVEIQEEDEPETKKNSSAPRLGLSVVPIKYLAGFHWIGDDEAVTLEMLPEYIVAQLPKPIRMNKRHPQP